MKRILSLLLLLCLAACVPTPDKEPIINRTDAYENIETVTVDGPQNVFGDVNEQTDIPHIDAEYTTPRGVPVSIHADVTIPAETNIPILRVQPCTFSKEQILEWIGILAPDAMLCEQPQDPFSREYYADRIREEQEAIEQTTDPNELEYHRETLDYYVEAYNKAKPESEIDRDKPFDPDRIGKKNYITIILRKDGETVGSVAITKEADDDFPRYVFEYAPAGSNNYTGDVDICDPKAELMPFSEAEAVETAYAFLERLGISKMQHTYSEIMFRYNDAATIAETPGAYRLFFTRTVNGMPRPHYWIKSWQLGYSESDKQAYRPVWTPEYIDILVDARGVQRFRWQNPVEIVETVSENVQVISLDEARKSFDTYIDILRAAGDYVDGNAPIEITEIIFGYEFLPVKDSLDVFDLVPCWFFMGYDAESKLFRQRGAQLIINAIDGKIPQSD